MLFLSIVRANYESETKVTGLFSSVADENLLTSLIRWKVRISYHDFSIEGSGHGQIFSMKSFIFRITIVLDVSSDTVIYKRVASNLLESYW